MPLTPEYYHIVEERHVPGVGWVLTCLDCDLHEVYRTTWECNAAAGRHRYDTISSTPPPSHGSGNRASKKAERRIATRRTAALVCPSCGAADKITRNDDEPGFFHCATCDTNFLVEDEEIWWRQSTRTAAAFEDISEAESYAASDYADGTPCDHCGRSNDWLARGRVGNTVWLDCDDCMEGRTAVPFDKVQEYARKGNYYEEYKDSGDDKWAKRRQAGMTRKLEEPVDATCPSCGKQWHLTHENVPTGSTSPRGGPGHLMCDCGTYFEVDTTPKSRRQGVRR